MLLLRGRCVPYRLRWRKAQRSGHVEWPLPRLVMRHGDFGLANDREARGKLGRATAEMNRLLKTSRSRLSMLAKRGEPPPSQRARSLPCARTERGNVSDRTETLG